MSRSTKIMRVVGFALLAVAIGWWKWRSREVTKTPLPPPSVAERAQPQAPSEPIPSSNIREIRQPFARTPYIGLSDPRWVERRRLHTADPAYEWKTPIEFFGKVVDEKNQPVASAEIDYSWNGTTEKYGRDGVKHETMTSDAGGLFHIHGIEGKGMTVYVKKPGYYSRGYPQGNFEYAGFWEPRFIEPDRNKPTVFHLIKRSVAEPTYSVSKRLILPPPSWATHIDLLAEEPKISTGGDISLRIIRPSNPGYQQSFDWELKIDGVDGADIVESDDEFMLRAPDEGYQASVSKAFRQVRGNSTEVVKFYVRHKANRLYSAVSLEVTPYYLNHITKEDTSCIIVTAIVNPNDSPNVEYDREKDIRKMARK